MCFSLFRFVVREKYPSNRGKERLGPPGNELLSEIFSSAKSDETLKKVLNHQLGTFQYSFI